MTTDNNNEPILRFPGLQGDWIKTKLGNAATFINGRAYKQEELLEKGKYPVLRVGNFFSNSSWYYSDLELEPNKYCNEGDLLYAWSASFGPRIWNEGKTIYHYHIWKVQCSKDNDTKYIYYLLSNETEKLKASASNGLGMLHITKGAIESWAVALPPPLEQQKIAFFLTAIDAKIELLTKKKALLDKYKKGVMQQLFSQQIRFKDDEGNDFPEWEEKNLGELYSFKSTNSYSREKLNYENGEVKNIHYGDIHTKFRTLFDTAKEYVPYLNPDISVERVADENYCREGDMIFADASEDVIDVGKSIEIINLNGDKVLSGLHTILARPKSGEMAIGFGGYLFKSDLVRIQIQKESQGSKVLSISTKRLSNITLVHPTVLEQKKIVKFLIAIDTKIEALQKQEDSIKKYKKGLLQQLFV